jgi:hypothetical protein
MSIQETIAIEDNYNKVVVTKTFATGNNCNTQQSVVAQQLSMKHDMSI